MTQCNCPACLNIRRNIDDLRSDLRYAVRMIDQRAGTPQATRARRQIPELKAFIADYKSRLTEHESTPALPAKSVSQRVYRAPKPKPAPKSKPRIEIDTEALAAALSTVPEPTPCTGVGTNTLAATGRCHTCDRPISGERRFCGRCLVKRGTT